MAYYTLAQAAERLGVAPASLRKYVSRGLLRAEKLGRDWLVKDSEIRAYQARVRPAHRPAKKRKPDKR